MYPNNIPITNFNGKQFRQINFYKFTNEELITLKIIKTSGKKWTNLQN
jgi:hypothetical protein